MRAWSRPDEVAHRVWRTLYQIRELTVELADQSPCDQERLLVLLVISGDKHPGFAIEIVVGFEPHP